MPFRQQLQVGGYVLKQRLSRDMYPLVLML